VRALVSGAHEKKTRLTFERSNGLRHNVKCRTQIHYEMKIAIVGAGLIGLNVGGRLAAVGGHDVTFFGTLSQVFGP